MNMTCCAKVMNSPCVICLFCLAHRLHIAQFFSGAIFPPRHQPITVQPRGVGDEPCDQTPCSLADLRSTQMAERVLVVKARPRLLNVAAIPLGLSVSEGLGETWQRLVRCRAAALQEADCGGHRTPIASSKRPLPRPVEKQTC